MAPILLTTGADGDLRGDRVYFAFGILELQQYGRPGTNLKRRVQHQPDAGCACVNEMATDVGSSGEAVGWRIASEAIDLTSLPVATDLEERAQYAAQLNQP